MIDVIEEKYPRMYNNSNLRKATTSKMDWNNDVWE